MPGNVRPVADERDALLAYLAQQRHVLRITAYRLTDEQARSTPTPSALSVGGIVKHVTAVERYWMRLVAPRSTVASSESAYEDNFRLGSEDSLQSVLDDYAEAARETETVVGAIADLGQAVPVPHEVPWFPEDVDAWSVRWVLLHLITEMARHAGHADIVREALDGATGFPLMAAAEQWPATPWLQPWEPESGQELSVAAT
jgi:uncharacterized damage-inducible protein DinB